MSYFTWDMKSEVLDDYAAQGLCSSCYKPIEYRLSDECLNCIQEDDNE